MDHGTCILLVNLQALENQLRVNSTCYEDTCEGNLAIVLSVNRNR